MRLGGALGRAFAPGRRSRLARGPLSFDLASLDGAPSLTRLGADDAAPGPSVASIAIRDMGSLGRRALLLEGLGSGEELLARGLEDLPFFEDLAAEYETAFRGYLGGAGQLDGVGEDYADAARSGAARPARAMSINGRLFGQIEAEDVGDARYVEASGPEVAREEVAQRARGEALEGDAAGFLVHARVDRADGEAEGGEGRGGLLDAGGHREEHETALRADGGLEAPGEIQALASVAVEAPMLDAPREDRLARRRDLDRVAQEGPQFPADALGYRGRYEDARAGGGGALEQ